MNTNRTVILSVIVALIIIGGAAWFFSQQSAVSQNISWEKGPDTLPSATGENAGGDAMEAGGDVMENQEKMSPTSGDMHAVKEFNVTGSNFKFSPNEIRVKRGDTVRILFKSEGWNHDWRVDEFHAATKIVPAGGTDTIEFIADKAGTFEFYCSVGTHRQMGMKGNLIVE